MDMRANKILNKIRNAQSSWDTTQLVDPNAAPPAQGQPPQPGAPMGGLNPASLAGLTTPQPPGLDAGKTLEESMAPETPKMDNGMSKLDTILKLRNRSKQNFLGGGND
jgi:hypothetical protein